MKRRLMCWPLRLKWRTHWYTFFLAGAQYTGTRGTFQTRKRALRHLAEVLVVC